MEKCLEEASTVGVPSNNNCTTQGLVSNDNILPLVSVITLGIVWIIHDLVTHGYSAEAEADIEKHKVRIQMKSNGG